MQSLLLSAFLLGLVVGDNTTTEQVFEIANSPGSYETDATGQGLSRGDWSSWSKWSPCTRSCDGGISRQQRRCRRKPCKGRPWNFRYKICNTQPCDEPSDFRAEQCAAFDNVPYSGQLLKWSPHYDSTRPCSLICRGEQSFGDGAKPGDPRGGKMSQEDEDAAGVSLAELEADETIVVQLADRVQDGTRCRPESLDVCIGGECMKVGCDSRVGSDKVTDACGVCGGNGSSCRSGYFWSLESISVCSKSCGGGFRVAVAVCKTAGPGEDVQVDDSNCDQKMKPDKTLMPCNAHPCLTKWMTGDWGDCSASCGGGFRMRPVFCSEENGNGTTNEAPDHRCSGAHKPRHQESCNAVSCPMWEADQWSDCSASCGSGIRTRNVECRDGNGMLSPDCDPAEQPYSEQECRASVSCPSYHVELTQPLMQPYGPAPPIPEKLIDQPIPSESTFIADDWSPCSVSCGKGVRHREVHCKIYLEFSRTIAKLPDRQCSGPKPNETESCTMPPCGANGSGLSYRIDTAGDSGYAEPSLTDSYRSSSSSSSGTGYSEGRVKVAAGSELKSTYSWKEAGYTHCSATCLGGVQELIITCVRDDTGKTVTPLLCTPETKPESRIKTCNDHQCPPRWNYSDFAPCKSPCGLGIQTRDVTCIHEVTRGSGNTVQVPNYMCPQPPPPDRQYCNVLDCPVKWDVGQWGKCSRTCGGGIMTREVSCTQTMAQGHVQSRSESDCPSQKPSSKKPCNTRPCHDMITGDGQSIILSQNTTFNQQVPERKIELKIGGTATIFQGTSVVKIRCPVKKFDRTQVIWTKDRAELRKSRKYKINKRGALKIKDVSNADHGTYACIAGNSRAEIHLMVKLQPKGQLSSEEALHFSNTDTRDVNFDSAPSNSDENQHISHAAPAYGFAFNSEDLSHEARPDISTTTKRPRRKKQKPSPRAPDATGEYTVTSLHQPGHHESIEPSAASSASQLVPHLNRLISSLKAYWPFQGDTSSNRGHRMAPPLVLENLPDHESPATTRAFSPRNNELRYVDGESSDFGILRRNSVIPDDKFGPDEERIFIDDDDEDPYDVDEAIFALQHKETLGKTPRIIGIAAPRHSRVVPTKSAIDYIEESLRQTKRMEQSAKDFSRNQRGTGSEDLEEQLKTAGGKSLESADAYGAVDFVEGEKKHETIAPSDYFDRESARRRLEGESVSFGDRRGIKVTGESSSVDKESTRNVDRPTEASHRSEISVDTTLLGNTEELAEEEMEETRNDVTERSETEEPPDLLSSSASTAEAEGTEGLKVVEVDVEIPEGNSTEDYGTVYRDDIEDVPGALREEENSAEVSILQMSSNGRTSTQSNLEEEEASTLVNASTSPVVTSEKSSRDDLIFEWVTTEWSACSQTCGGGGFQMRGAQCTVRSLTPIANSTRISPKTVIGVTLCEDAGFPMPEKVRSCGSERCPQWYAGEWTPCESSRCFNRKTAMQRREVSCRILEEDDDGTQNVTVLGPHKCDDAVRPPQRQECYNDACKGVWRVGDWSKCTASCQQDGIKYRTLQCVWYGTKKPAGNACRDITRPSVMKTCRGSPCPQSPEDCSDHWQLCSRVKAMNMCQVPLYQKQCCQSCR